MLATPVLDVAIGLSFFFLLLALICTTVNEIIASKLNTRAKFLDQGIDNLLGGNAALKKQLYDHPLIKPLRPYDKNKDKNRDKSQPYLPADLPSYLPAEKFAVALLDIVSKGKPLAEGAVAPGAAVTPGADADLPYQAIRALGVSSQDVALLPQDAALQKAALQKNVEEWFNSGMDRVSGWYKKNAQSNALIAACIITLFVNADALSVAHILWTNPAVRATVVDLAEKRSKEPAPPAVEYEKPEEPTASTVKKTPSSPEESLSKEEQKELGELTGWQKDRDKFAKSGSDWLLTVWAIICDHFLGWLITAFAVSLGAPFWFDLLNRFMNIRNAGRAPDEPRDKSSSAASQQVTPPPKTEPAKA